MILVVGLLAIVTVALTLRSYLSSTKTATVFQDASYGTTNLANIQREALLLRIETHALFSDFAKGFESIKYHDRDFEEVNLRRDFLTAHLRVEAAQVSGDTDALARLEDVGSTLAEYDILLAFVRADATFDRLAAIAQSDRILIQLERQVKALYDHREIRFFQATGASLRAQKSAQTLLLMVSGVMLALSLVLAISLRQSVRTAFKRAYQALEAETKKRGRIEEIERRLMEEKAVVDEVARIITSTLDTEDVYERFAAEVKKLVDFDRMSVNIFDRQAGILTMKHTIGQEVSSRRVGDTWSLDGTPPQVVIATGQTLLRSDISDRQFAADQRYLDVDLRSMMLLPLVYQGTAIGCLALSSTNIGAYGPKEQVILERLAHQIAPAVANAELFEQRKQAEEAQRHLVEGVSDAIIASDERFVTTAWNRAAEEMYGWTAEEVIGRPTVEFLQPEFVDVEPDEVFPQIPHLTWLGAAWCAFMGCPGVDQG